LSTLTDIRIVCGETNQMQKEKCFLAVEMVVKGPLADMGASSIVSMPALSVT